MFKRGRFRRGAILPFVYEAKNGKAVKMPFWRLPAEAYDDEDALRRWASLAVDAARRAANQKARKAARGKANKA